MCGITGIVGKDAIRYKAVVQKMNHSIAHRGPDGDGFLQKKNCVLGHRRLSIVDLEGGQQPMSTDDGISIVFNGEFYGYQSVKNSLNYSWKTNSDTEVILALYKKYGPHQFVQHINGMFAFALWDEPNQIFVAARDRFGEKPFYYAVSSEQQLIFASELKAIQQSELVTLSINHDALRHYLQHLYVHPTDTIYNEVHSLGAGEYMIIENQMLSRKVYWTPPEVIANIPYQEAKQTVRKLVEQAVDQQLVADVPVASFLSGGIDSSIISALAAQRSSKQFTSISFSFNHDESELPFSRLIAKKFNINNIELHANDFDIAEYFCKMNEVYDEPFADSSAVPTFIIAQLAAQHFKCIITGDGGDEMFGGYQQWYQPIYNQMYPTGFINKLTNQYKKIKYSKYRQTNLLELHRQQNMYFNDKEVLALMKTKTSAILHETNHLGNTIENLLLADAKNYMQGDILVKTDRAAMANSLELRAPFLNVPLADFCLQLPIHYKVSNKDTKLILKDAFADILPQEIVHRKKQGFGSPVNAWLQMPKMQQLKKDLLQNPQSSIYDILHFDSCQPYIKDNNYKTWILLTLALWMNKK